MLKFFDFLTYFFIMLKIFRNFKILKIYKNLIFLKYIKMDKNHYYINIKLLRFFKKEFLDAKRKKNFRKN
ncbi:hypothetical protein A0M43_08665 [Campylobacter jejuni]|nr:hypothetical protein AJY68_08365 [Campylobacter jejuni]OEW46924.1 hypothetical protein AJ888_03315 [Campylobacter sp. BCW_6467]PCH27583.1 hypothetical protein BGS44_00810 [Campylobacter sp. 111]OEW32083.1 hypothetical protein AJ879_03975 [Campylobacter jejuni]OEX00238.1 hypothetical protein A0M43_08665 [Campylobacter jejuni]